MNRSGMKVLIIHNYYVHRAGESQAVLREKELLESYGHTVLLYTKDNQILLQLSIWKRFFLFFTMLFSWSSFWAIKKIAQQERPDVAHIHNVYPLISPSVYWALKKFRIPILQVLHNYRFFCPNGLLLDQEKKICEKCRDGRLISAFLGRCYRNSSFQTMALVLCLKLHRRVGTFRKIDRYLAPSVFMRSKMIEAGFPPDRVLIKRHHVDLTQFKPSPEHGGYAIYMGRLSREKGIPILLEAFAVPPPITLHIFGDGPLKKQLQEQILARELFHIQVHGYVDSPQRFEWLKNAAFLVFPSEWYENAPYTLIESMALGVPAVASRIGGITEIIEHGKTGLLFEPGNGNELQIRIRELHNNAELLSDIRKQARLKAEREYGKEQAYTALLSVYAGLGILHNPVRLQESQ